MNAQAANMSISPLHLDLVLLLDRIGDATTVKSRCEFARAVVDALLAELTNRDLLRTGVVLFDDHDPVERAHLPARRPVGEYLLDDYAALLNVLGNVRAIDPAELDFESALADALDTLNSPRWEWQEGGKRLSLLIGSRPPHPSPGTQVLRQVPDGRGRDWRAILAGLRDRLALNTIALLCPIYWPSGGAPLPDYAWPYLAACWAELGKDGFFEAEVASPQDIACAVLNLIRTDPA